MCWVILGFITGMSLVSYVAFVVDKRRAGTGQRRIPERTLLLLGYAGGVAGGVMAMRAVRHKTRKQPFNLLYLLGIPVVLAWALGLAWRLGCT